MIFELIGKFPLDINCHVIPNIAVFLSNEMIRVNNELDSPVFLYREKGEYFIQVASQTNGSKILLHEDDVILYQENIDKPVDLFEVNIQPLNRKNND